jgi:hypothetical protein
MIHSLVLSGVVVLTSHSSFWLQVLIEK